MLSTRSASRSTTAAISSIAEAAGGDLSEAYVDVQFEHGQRTDMLTVIRNRLRAEFYRAEFYRAEFTKHGEWSPKARIINSASTHSWDLGLEETGASDPRSDTSYEN